MDWRKRLVESFSRSVFRGMKRRIAADGVLDAALLPRGVRVAEEGLHQEALQGKVGGELGAVVEGDGTAQCLRYGFEQAYEMASDTGGELAFDGNGEQQEGGALVDGQDGLPGFGEDHQIGFPVAGTLRSAPSAGRSASETRPSMKLAGLPPRLPRWPRLLLPRGR